MFASILSILFTIIALFAGIFAVIFWFISYADDKEMLAPAQLWLAISVGCFALSYLVIS